MMLVTEDGNPVGHDNLLNDGCFVWRGGELLSASAFPSACRRLEILGLCLVAGEDAKTSCPFAPILPVILSLALRDLKPV